MSPGWGTILAPFGLSFIVGQHNADADVAVSGSKSSLKNLNVGFHAKIE